MTMAVSPLAQDVAAELELAFGAIGDLKLGPLHTPEQFDGPTTSFKRHESASHDTSDCVDSGIELDDKDHELPPQTPIHPIPTMQKEFEESILEAMNPLLQQPLKDRGNAESRRRQLLELEDFSDEYSSRWRQKPGARYHPLRKLVAQISYGVYLLHKRKAIDESEVVRILQGHVDEVDSFVEDSVADLDLACRDITERIEHLMLPLEHSRTFNRMLCERNFRESIIEGNEIIERVIVRTSVSMRRAMDDVRQGLSAALELARYLRNLEAEWKIHTQDLITVYDAMRGNADGWSCEFQKLQSRSDELEKLMLRLGYIVDEVAKRCGIASRRKTPSGLPGSRPIQDAPEATAYVARNIRPSRSSTITDKPLPAPPRRISTNPSSLPPRASAQRPPVTLTEHRPSLSSSPSLQTLDCLRPPPTRPDADTYRPSSSSTSPPTRSVRFENPPSSRSPLSRIESQKSNSAATHRSSNLTLASAIVNIGTPTTELFPRSSPTSQLSYTRENALAQTPMMSKQSSAPGLGIQHPLDDARPSATVSSSRKHPSHLVKVTPQRPSVPRAPASDPTSRPNQASSPIKKHQTTPLGSISPFPTLVNPRERRSRAGDLEGLASKRPSLSSVGSHPTSPRDGPGNSGWPQLSPSISPSSDVEERSASITEVTGTTGARSLALHGLSPSSPPEREVVVATPSIASPGVQYSESPCSDAPTLSPTNHAASDSLATVSTMSPQTPNDLFPVGGLRSHPVDPGMYNSPDSKGSFTALPTFPSRITASASMTQLPSSKPSIDQHEDFSQPELRKRTLLPKKPSLATMRTLFARKSSPKEIPREMRLGAGGLGGCVAPT